MAGVSAPRCVALVGPYLSGKTTLLENILFACGKIGRKGTAKEGNTVGDASAEARHRRMSTEMTVANCEFMGDRWTFLDCPGSVEFAQDMHNALLVADAAVVVCEPIPERALALAPILRFLDDHSIPHMLFVNKMDGARQTRIRDLLSSLQGASERPLALRQVPIRDGEAITGYVDLVSERAYKYKPGQASDLIQMPAAVKERETEARQALLESLADFDDKLLEQLLGDAVPPKQDIYKLLTSTVHADRVVPVFIGAAEQAFGVRRLLKALRHEVPGPDETAARLGYTTKHADAAARIFKTIILPHIGKLSVARVWSGEVVEGMTLNGMRVAGLSRLLGAQQEKLPKAGAGEVVALARMDAAKTGEALTVNGAAVKGLGKWPAPMAPLFAVAIDVKRREDDVKLSPAIARLAEEDPSFVMEMNQDTHETLLRGQGEIHLQVGIERLKNKYNIDVAGKRPRVAYKETIRKNVAHHSRFKRQSGGHGQFADIQIEIRPLPRGSGFVFEDKIVGGRIPRQYIPAVEQGIRDYLAEGPLGFPVVDIAVRLTDGQFHSVDSSDQAFKTAAGMGMREAMPKCDPVLLEPIAHVTISAPAEFTARVHSLISGRRGHILGFGAREGWRGWDEAHAHMPESELHDLIIELRSLSQGIGSFSSKFDHLQELSGRAADQVVKARAAEKEGK
ncbi:MAG: elongation factor G [Alphaproteobacteria bacterium]